MLYLYHCLCNNVYFFLLVNGQVANLVEKVAKKNT